MLWEITGRMRSHNVTCHPAVVTAFTPAKAGTQFTKAELTWMVVITQDSLPAKDGHLSQI